MPRIRSVSDLHCSILERWNTEALSLADKHDFIRAIGLQARNEHAEVLLFPGDTLDERGRPKFLRRDADVVADAITNFGGHVIVQRGNHDSAELFKRRHIRKLLGKPDVVDESPVVLPGGVLSVHGHGWSSGPQRESTIELAHYLLLQQRSHASHRDVQGSIEETHERLVAALMVFHDGFRVLARVREHRDALRKGVLSLCLARMQSDAHAVSVLGNPDVAMKHVRRLAARHDIGSPICAAQFAALHGCPVALTGHTHHASLDAISVWSPQLQKEVSIVVANSGSAIQRDTPLQSLFVDTDHKTIELQTFDAATKQFATAQRVAFTSEQT